MQSKTKSTFLRIKESIEEALSKEYLEKTKLNEAARYALKTGGKRLRPIIVHLVADALGNDLDVTPVALATEFSHTASLIADDLPCMDNDDFRRGTPSLHKKFDESTALLVSYGLISDAFGKIEENGQLMKNAAEPFRSNAHEAVLIGLECASRCAGMKGAALGQHIDLCGELNSLESIEHAIYLKTITLFEGAFVLGWVFGGGDLQLVAKIKQLSYHFGLAFQIRDDILDIPQDREREFHANYALALGEEAARDRFHDEMGMFFALCETVHLTAGPFNVIYEMLAKDI